MTSLAPAEEVGEGVVGRGHCLQVISLSLCELGAFILRVSGG